MTSDIVNLLNQAANRYGVPPELALAVAEQESGGNPNAVSSHGAQGVMQLMPGTAVSLGVSNPLDPLQNIDAGVRFLAQLLSEFGDIALALAAYNWGPGNVSKYGYNNWPAETVTYVSRILARIGQALTPPAPAPSPAPVPSTPAPIDAIDPTAYTPEPSLTGTELLAILAGLGLVTWAVIEWSG